jgi:aspartyl-tRNA(Asn)/glutamyl-tRNA(Gln) amidotransferase subunit C
MKVTEKEVTYVADLANLDLTADERTRMVRDLNSILGFIDTLNELDTSNVPPMAQVMAATSADAAKGSAQFAFTRRDDVPKPSLSHEAALQNAPDHDADFFKVPKVIER